MTELTRIVELGKKATKRPWTTAPFRRAEGGMARKVERNQRLEITMIADDGRKLLELLGGEG